MIRYFENLAKALLGRSYGELASSDKRVIASIVEHTTVAENVNASFSDSLSFGQKVADSVAAFGGSWAFIGLFFAFIFFWIALNTIWLVSGTAFDPYPFILLNLGLSSLAAFQAPIIMMSQNRQADKDRIKQDAAYQINLKMELQIMRLHSKVDALAQEESERRPE